MLKHSLDNPIQPSRVVILGATGFVGSTTLNIFKSEGTETLALGRSELDLLEASAGSKLTKLLKPTDTVILISAEAPCKNAEMLIRNIQMMVAVCKAISQCQPEHVIYISSDAVYGDSMYPLDETSSAEPGSIHGAMHLTREIMLKTAVQKTLAIIRPTLIYGLNDPHNGYGPNRFRRLIATGEKIVLFGEGEEQRDHILVNDVAELVRLIALHKSKGVLNAATGTVTSFRTIAEMLVQQTNTRTTITSSPRIGKMPHNGYRSFDPTATITAFPDFRYTPLHEGLSA